MKDKLQVKAKHIKVSQCLKSLLNWTVPDTDATKLAECLLEALRMSIAAQISPGEWKASNETLCCLQCFHTAILIGRESGNHLGNLDWMIEKI